jgi:hypothetical protein
MSPVTESDEKVDPADVHLCRCGQRMVVRDETTLGYREDPPVYVCPKRATERRHETWAGDISVRLPVA